MTGDLAAHTLGKKIRRNQVMQIKINDRWFDAGWRVEITEDKQKNEVDIWIEDEAGHMHKMGEPGEEIGEIVISLDD